MSTPQYTSTSRFPIKQPKGICRGCRGVITDKRRQTWCSSQCQEKFHPFYVKKAVAKRDENKCVFCGKDCSRSALGNYTDHPKAPDYIECGLQYPYDFKAHHNSPLYKAYKEELKQWERNGPFSEFDHIIPHSEGGLFVLENIRLLCRACHLERTRLWHKQRKSVAISS